MTVHAIGKKMHLSIVILGSFNCMPHHFPTYLAIITSTLNFSFCSDYKCDLVCVYGAGGTLEVG